MGQAKAVRCLAAASVALVLSPVGVQSRCDLQKVNGAGLSLADFQSKYWESTPLLLTNLISAWPALQEARWTGQALLESYGSQALDSSHVSGNSRKGRAFSDGTSLEQFLAGQAPGNLSWFLEPHAPLVRDMLRRGDFAIPAALGAVHREGPFLSLARRGQWNPVHSHETSWFAQVEGTKRWLLLPPGRRSPTAVHLGDADLDLCRAGMPAAMARCDTEAGQVLYLPSNYAHGTCALSGPSVGLAFIGSPGFLAGARRKSPGSRDRRDIGLCLRAKMGGLTEPDVRKARRTLRAELLRLVAASDGLDLVRHLCDQGTGCQSGARPPSSQGVTPSPIAAAVEAGAWRVVKHLAGVVDLRGEAPRGGQTLLHLAAAEGHARIAELLVQRGLDPSAADQSPMRNTPAFLAAWHGHLPVLKLLLARGADPWQLNAEGLGLWQLAAFELYFYVIEYLHGLLRFDLREFLEWAERVEAPPALVRFIRLMMREQRTGVREL